MYIKKHEKFMRIAINEATKALKEGNRSFGAILVKNSKIMAKAHNTTVTDNDPTAHAEINVIRKLCKKLRNNNLKSYTLYTSAEPCPMCAAACIWAGISRVVYGASIQDIIKTGRKEIKMSCKEVIEVGFKKIEVVGGILKEECLKHFQV